MRLDQWMKEQDINYYEFADLIGTSVPTLSRIRNGQLPIIVRVVREIERYTLGKVMLKDICDLKPKENKKEKKTDKKKCNDDTKDI